MSQHSVQSSVGLVVVDVPDDWSSFSVPGTAASWVAPHDYHGFLPNVVIVDDLASTSRGSALFEESIAGMAQFPDALLVDYAMPSETELNYVLSYLHPAGHRLTLLQRIITGERGNLSVSVTIPDLAVCELESVWRALLQSVVQEGSA